MKGSLLSMQRTKTFSLALATAGVSGSLLFGASAVLAAPATATLSLTPASGQQLVSNNFPVDVTLNTGGQSVSAVDIKVIIPAGLQYVSDDTTGSVVDQEVTAPTVSGNTLRFARATFSTGYNGTGKLITLTFKPLATGSQSLTIDQANSETDAYSDSTNILQSVNNAQFSVVAAPVQSSGGSNTTTGNSSATATSSTQGTAVQSHTAVKKLPVTGNPFVLFAIPIIPFALAILLWRKQSAE